ncbi:hypothetical protein ASPCAL07151 [Aspergillus calidoustus]|uniref:Uncharacterized protein n=1 Tax=Aspergillus calidoustus TaxID=454130 RepID=A0A0U5G6X2_ASPCI|nr:hypothetical protein ASPCAL07151 [Aspergillus calidoustus]
MFIPYHSPSEDRRKWRRVINSFTAEKAAQKRPLKTPEVSLGSFVEWSDPEHNNAERISQSSARNGRLRIKRPAARQKVYRMTSMGRRLPEPLGSWALSYYFDVICPHDSRVFGHCPSSAKSYVSALHDWSSKNAITRHGLVAFALCTLIPGDRTGEIYAATIFYRKRLLDDVHRMLATDTVDDVLVHALSLLIPIDDYLGWENYSRTHVPGFRAVIQARGGFDQIGQSLPAMRDAVVASSLLAQSLLVCHEDTLPRDQFTHSSRSSAAFPERYTHSDLPRGFVELIQGGYLSSTMIEILQGFSAWHGTYLQHNPRETPTWLSPTTTLSNLTHLEKCILVSLRCLADDMSAMALHPASQMHRQTEKRAEMLLNLAYSGRDSWKSNCAVTDCLIWLSFVICAPVDHGIAADGMQKEVFRALLVPAVLERGSAACGAVQRVLRSFFYDEGRAQAWEATWEKFLAPYRDPHG